MCFLETLSMNSNRGTSHSSQNPWRSEVEDTWVYLYDATAHSKNWSRDAPYRTVWVCNDLRPEIQTFFSPLVLRLSCIHLFIHLSIQRSLTACSLLSVLRWRDSCLLLICLSWATLISKCVKFTQSLQQPYKLNANICLPFADQGNGVQIASVTCRRPDGGWIVYLEAVPDVWLHG